MFRKILLLVLLFILPLAGCKKKKLLILGIDSLDLREASTYMEAGLMPNLLELYNNSLSGPLETDRPTVSAIIWTTIATGVPKERHGITSFWVKNNPESEASQIMTSMHRKVPAWWNYLTEEKIKLANFGWWTTFPAEEVYGYNLTNMAYHYYRERIKGATFPETLLNDVAYISVDLSRVLYNYGGFLTIDEQFAMQESGPKRNSYVWESFYRDIFHTESALYVIEKNPDVQVLSVFLDELDLMKHHYMNYKLDLITLSEEDYQVAPSVPFVRLSEEDMEKINALPEEERRGYTLKIMENVIRKFHQKVDMLMGKIVDTFVDENTLVMILSDHGFDYTETEQTAGDAQVPPGHKMGPPGTLLLAGSGITPGHFAGATIYDVLPTILAYFRVKEKETLPGKSLLGVLPTEPVQKIIPHDPADAGLGERLKSLGYTE